MPETEDMRGYARVHFIASPQILADIDDWRRRQEDLPSRSEAIRRILEAYLRQDVAAANPRRG
jgi:metal-responsive CopG/Arc/MetJ family transcriptional regulator